MSLFPLNNYATGTAPAVPATPATPAARTNAPTDSGAVKIANIAAVAANAKTTAASAENIKLDNAVDAINKFLKPVASSIEFSIDKNSGRTVVQVIDTDTNDVLRQFPSKEALAISLELDRYQGILLKDKA